jgi:adenylate kinase family enzyme
MRKVLVIGSGGAGKSTLARQIAERTKLPLVHLDQLYWHSGWRPTGDGEWDAVIESLLRQDAWVMDGNYGRTLARRLAACDTVVFLDRSRWVCLWRVVRRWLRFAGRDRPDMPAGCPERLSWEFVVWIWQYPRRRRPGILGRLNSLSDKRVEILSDQPAIDRFMARLADGSLTTE